MASSAQVAPPLTVPISAAALAPPPPPTVEPTAQHFLELTQSRPERVLTGAGTATVANEPSQGELAANVGGGEAFEVLLAQAAAVTTTSRVVTTAVQRIRLWTTWLGRITDVTGLGRECSPIVEVSQRALRTSAGVVPKATAVASSPWSWPPVISSYVPSSGAAPPV